MADADSTVVRDHSWQDLNPLLNFHSDGSLDLEESLSRIKVMSEFLTHYHTLTQHSEADCIDHGLYLINATMRAAVRKVHEQVESACIVARAADILAERERGSTS